MNNRTITNLIIGSFLSLALAMVIWSPIHSQSGATAEKKMMDDKMMNDCQEMMEQKQKMMAEMKAQDADITAQIAKMNSAADNKKLDLLAAVVTHMAEHRASMNVKMEEMHEEMMNHMMKHMQMGQESMSQCPMMMGMKNMDEKAAHEHNGHQEKGK